MGRSHSGPLGLVVLVQDSCPRGRALWEILPPGNRPGWSTLEFPSMRWRKDQVFPVGAAGAFHNSVALASAIKTSPLSSFVLSLLIWRPECPSACRRQEAGREEAFHWHQCHLRTILAAPACLPACGGRKQGWLGDRMLPEEGMNTEVPQERQAMEGTGVVQQLLLAHLWLRHQVTGKALHSPGTQRCSCFVLRSQPTWVYLLPPSTPSAGTWHSLCARGAVPLHMVKGGPLPHPS